jgi:hypothetical protein
MIGTWKYLGQVIPDFHLGGMKINTSQTNKELEISSKIIKVFENGVLKSKGNFSIYDKNKEQRNLIKSDTGISGIVSVCDSYLIISQGYVDGPISYYQRIK